MNVSNGTSSNTHFRKLNGFVIAIVIAVAIAFVLVAVRIGFASVVKCQVHTIVGFYQCTFICAPVLEFYS